MSDKLKIPDNIFAVIIFTLITLIYITTPHLSTTWARSWLEIILLVFVSGYALITALFPSKGSIGWIIQIVSSFIISFIIVYLVDLALDLMSMDSGLMPILISVLTLAACVIGIVRYNSLPKIEDIKRPAPVFNFEKVFGKANFELNIPTDLFVVMVFIILTVIFILVPQLSNSWVRTILELPIVLFFPGYALIAALFPRKDDLDGIERTALSFGLSIVVVPLVGLGLNYTPWGIRIIPILTTLSIFTIGMCLIAAYRRSGLLEMEAFSVPFMADILENLQKNVFEQDRSRLNKALSIILVISILASVAMLVYVVVTPKQGKKFTEFYILGPGGMADDYPTDVVIGDSGTVIVGVVNHEYATINYLIALVLENGSSTHNTTIRLEHNETWEQPITFTPSKVGDEMKLQFLLFKENNNSVPYRDLHLWIDVSGIEDGI